MPGLGPADLPVASAVPRAGRCKGVSIGRPPCCKGVHGQWPNWFCGNGAVLAMSCGW